MQTSQTTTPSSTRPSSLVLLRSIKRVLLPFLILDAPRMIAGRALACLLLCSLAHVATAQVSCAAGQADCDGSGSQSTCCACVAGKYKETTSTASCVNCGLGKYSTTVGATVASTCLDCAAGKYSATAGVESVCVVCVCVFSKKKKRDTYTLYHTQFIHNTYKWRKHKSVSTNNRRFSYTHSLSIYR